MLLACQDVVDWIDAGHWLNPEQECTRGLELHMASVKDKRREIMTEALCSVLDEQDLQRDEGVDDPELLADIYFLFSYECGDAAHEAGLRDMNEVLQ